MTEIKTILAEDFLPKYTAVAECALRDVPRLVAALLLLTEFTKRSCTRRVPNHDNTKILTCDDRLQGTEGYRCDSCKALAAVEGKLRGG